MQNEPKKAEITCPVCNQRFIPEAFHLEKTIFDTSSNRAIVPYQNLIKEMEIKPFNIIRRAWITNCPHCNYLLKFLAEIGKKELIDPSEENVVGVKFSEFGKVYKYNFYNYNKPFMDYSDYLSMQINKIRTLIKETLDKISIDEWGALYRGFKNEEIYDSFKFLIRFYSYLENYCNSQVDDFKNKEMAQKIQELNLPKSFAELIEKVRKLRNQIAHHDYELSINDEEIIENGFISFVYYLVLKNLKALEIIELIENTEYDFIDVESIKFEIRIFLHAYLFEILRFKDYIKNFLLPLLEELNIPT